MGAFRLMLAGLVLALWGTQSGAVARAPGSGAHERQDVVAALMEAGYSGVATLRRERLRWVGVGAHDGDVVAFAVDAATLRITSEVKAR